MIETVDLTLHCPDIDSQIATIEIKEVLMNTPGVVDAEVSLDHKTVRVRLSDPSGEVTVRRMLSNAGYPAED